MKSYKLKDITDIITCGVAKRPQYVDDGVMFLSSQNVKSDKIILSKYNMISENDYMKLTKINKPEKGDILYTRVGSFGEAAVIDIDGKFAVYVSLTLIKPKKDLVNNRYLMHYLNSPRVKEFAMNNTRGIGVQNLNVDTVREFDIILPEIYIQCKIVKVLDKAKELIDKRKEQIQALNELVKSQFIELFGNPITNPKGWNKERLNDLGELARGKSKHRPRNAPELLNGPYPLVQTGDIANAGIYLNEYRQTYSELGLKQSKMWDKGTLCITIAANIAKTSILTFDACFPDSVVAFIPNEKTNNMFIQLWMSFLQKILEDSAPESAQKNINLKILSEQNVIVPPIEIQNQFADFVKQVDKLKFEMENSLKELEDNFNALMQKAFNGELF